MDEKHYLAPLFEPRSVAIIGATERADALGSVLVQNVLGAGFKGTVHAINPKHRSVHGLPCHRHIRDAPAGIDLAVIATPARTVPAIVAECGRAGVKTAVVLSAGFGESGQGGAAQEVQALQSARAHNMRILGPNSMGIARPGIGLNATFALGQALPGSIGLISQSGALCAAILDYARPNGIGFSNVVSLGLSSDLDFGEVLDYMVWDHRTESILLYIEGIRDARRFLSALRAAARAKPVLVLKTGRHPQGHRAAQTHTGAIAGDDAVFDAALRRAGVVRLSSLSQLYGASKALFTHFQPCGNRLAIITNGGGPGVMAADRAGDLGIPLADLATDTLVRLDRLLPPEWSRDNPIDLVSDSDPDRYAAALEALLSDPNVDGVLCLLTPQAMTRPVEVARRVIALRQKNDKPILTCWLGEEHCREARQMFQAAGIPSLRTPENAVELFHNLSNYYRNQKLLTQVAAPITEDHPPMIEAARLIVDAALGQRRTVLLRQEALALLAAFHIPTTPSQVAHNSDEAEALAGQLGYPVTLRPNSPLGQTRIDDMHTRRNLASAVAVHLAFQELHDEMARHLPHELAHGILVQAAGNASPMHDMMLQVWQDPVFGPAIGVGERSLDTHHWPERVVALPPLNAYLAHDLLQGTRIARGHTAMAALLENISDLVCELPGLRSMMLNPISLDDHDPDRNATVIDARIEIGARPAGHAARSLRYEHMAIHPYPSSLVRRIAIKDGRSVLLRPLKPEDAELEQEFVRRLSPETKYFRFMSALRELPPSLLAKLTQIDYDREMAFIATIDRDEEEFQIGVCRYATNPDGDSCEFAIVVADEFQKSGLGRQLMQVLIDTAHARGLKFMKGDFLSSNERMLRFVQNIGFRLSTDPDDNSLRHGTLELARAATGQ